MPSNIPQVPRDEPAHPLRCQASSHAQGNQGSQCWNMRTEGSEYCAAHGGHMAVKSAKKAASRMYDLGQYNARLEQMLDPGDNEVLSLRNEIGIARMALEALIKECKSASELMINSQKINMTVQLIGKLVTDAKKLESSLGHLLDRQTVSMLCDKIVEIISTTLADIPGFTEDQKSDLVAKAASQIAAAVDSSIMQRVAVE